MHAGLGSCIQAIFSFSKGYLPKPVHFAQIYLRLTMALTSHGTRRRGHGPMGFHGTFYGHFRGNPQ